MAGGELLTLTLILLFGADLKHTEGLSLPVSLPTMLGGSPAGAALFFNLRLPTISNGIFELALVRS